MFRKELVIALFGFGIGGMFYAVINLTQNPRSFITWFGIVMGIIAFVFLWRAIMWIDKDEKKQTKKENDDRDAKLLLIFESIIHREFEILINEIRKDRNERNNKPQTPDNNTTK